MLLLTDSYTLSEKQTNKKTTSNIYQPKQTSPFSQTPDGKEYLQSRPALLPTPLFHLLHGTLLNTGLTHSSGHLFTTTLCLDKFKYEPIHKLQVCSYLTNSHILEIVSQVDWLHPNQPFPMNSDHFVNNESATRPVSFPSYQVPFGTLVFSPQCFVCFGLVLVSALSVLDNGFFFKTEISESRGWEYLTLAILVFCLEYQRAQVHPTPNVMDDYSPYICTAKKGYSVSLSVAEKR